MWNVVVLSFFIISLTTAQNTESRPFDNGHGWDIRLAVPGEPGNDYPTLNSIPKTSFSCSGKEPGYYADVETNCQVFRVCTVGSTYGFQSFLCPNGTLFNQAVFVCDWWMKVNCRRSEELFKINNEKYGNLKLGPQFMSSIKKMITHPMRNPYDVIYTKNKLIVMQEYNPALTQQYIYNRSPNNAYFLAKQTQNSQFQDIYSTADISFAASTPATQHISNLSFYRPTTYNNIQNYKQHKPYVLPNRTVISKNIQNLNSHSRQTFQSQNNDLYNYNINTQTLRPTPIYQRSIQSGSLRENVKNNNSGNNSGNQVLASNKRNSKHTEFGIEFSKQQLNRNINHDKLLNSGKDIQAHHSKNIEGQIGNKTKQDLVSSETPPGIITKTLAFRRLIKDSTGNPKSRITFKTWILRPSKSSKLINDSTPYNHHRSQNVFEKIIDENPDDNDVSKPKPEIVETDNSYVYNAPTVKLDNEIITISQDQSANSISSTMQPEILTSYIPPTALPTKPSALYLLPTTFKPPSLLYIPAVNSEKQITRQYLPPIIENSKIVSIASSPRPFADTNKNEPSFFITKQTQVNTNHNNLAFSDILTKEKLDITVDKIVTDTNNVLETASPEEFQYVKQDVYSIDYPFDNYLHLDSDLDTQSDEKLILQPPFLPLPKNSRLIATPSSKLEPPIESFKKFNQSKNPISRLPYYEESTRRPNIIERTVSLKITIPENIAHILFKNSTIDNFDNLEILNTDDSNNWVLINKVAKNDTDVTPIGRLIWNKNSSIYDSQDLVVSLLLDSINAAKEYNNIAQQNIASPTQPTLTQPQFLNVENEKLQEISKDISQLTSSQFSQTNSSASFNLVNQGTNLNSINKYKTKSPTSSYAQKQILQQQHLIPSQQNIQKQRLYLVPSNKDDASVRINADKLYSGQLYQLPVPIVTKEIYNSPFPSNFKLPTDAVTFDSSSNIIDDGSQSNIDVEIIKSHTKGANSFQSGQTPIEASVDQGRFANGFIFELPKNGITAQIQDNIVGTLPHVQDENKQVKYKKEQTYYIYSHLNNEDEQAKNILNIGGINLARRVFPQNDKLSQLSTFQLVPSLSYTIQDEREKENILKTLQLNEHGNPKQIINNGNTNLILRQNAITNVDHRPKPIVLQSLYDGPNSYSAPQKSVVNLVEEQNDGHRLSNVNSKIEKFDTNEDTNSYGYPKISPTKTFLF